MAVYTKSDMANKTLAYMGVVAAGETPSSEDNEAMQEYVQSAYEELETFGLVPFLISAIPSWAWTSMKKYIASEAGPEWGKPRDPVAKREAEQELRSKVHSRKPPIPARGDYL